MCVKFASAVLEESPTIKPNSYRVNSLRPGPLYRRLPAEILRPGLGSQTGGASVSHRNNAIQNIINYDTDSCKPMVLVYLIP